jgi:hypothetical protein
MQSVECQYKCCRAAGDSSLDSGLCRKETAATGTRSDRS